MELAKQENRTQIDWSTASPRRRDDVLDYTVQDELVLYYPEGKLAVSLNDSARSIWELCDGTRTALVIAAKLAGDLGVDTTELFPDVEIALNEFYKLNVIDV